MNVVAWIEHFRSINLYVAIRVISVAMMLVIFLVSLIRDRRPNKDLKDMLIRAAAAAGVPSGLVLIWGAFDPSILVEVPGLHVPIAFGGLTLLFISVTTAMKKFE
jgi:hypothetical protein